MKQRILKLLPISIIILLAFLLRLYKVTSIPPSLNWDETSIAYNAYSILKTGKDEWGKVLPLHFKSFGEYKLPAQIYASIPGILIFGLNEFGVRITPVVYGTITVFLVYLLVVELSFKKKIAIFATFFIAISPWHIQLTRGSFESSFSLFWFLLGLIYLLKFLNEKTYDARSRGKYLVFSMLPLVISIYTYNTARVFTPIFLAIVVIIFFKIFWSIKSWSIPAGLFFVSLIIPLVPFVLSGEASARYKLVSITDDAGLVPRIEERRNLSKLPNLVTKLIHNRYTYNSYYFAKNYLSHFTPSFLIINGAGHKQHHVQGVGQLYWIQLPLLIYGFYILLRKKSQTLKILIPWLLVAFIPVSMTNDSIPNALRTLISVPVYQIFTAVGLYYLLKNLKEYQYKKIVIAALVLLLIVNFSIYIKKLFIDYSEKYSRDWQYGNKQVVEYIRDHIDDYSLIVFTRGYGEPHIFTLFYLQYDPSRFQNIKNLERFETYDWVRVLRFDRFYFPDLGDSGTRYEDVIKANKGKKILFIGKPGDFPKETKILERINFLDGSEAFEITTN